MNERAPFKDLKMIESLSVAERISLTMDTAALWQAQLDSPAAHEIFAETKVQNNIVDELDTLYPYIKEEIYYAGSPVRTSIDDEPAYRYTDTDQIEALQGIHQGFAIQPNWATGRPEIMQLVLTHHFKLINQDSEPAVTPFFSYLPMTASVMSVEMVESFMGNSHQSLEKSYEQISQVDDVSEEVAKLVHSRQFRRLSLDHQLNWLDEATAAANVAIDVRDLPLTILADQAFGVAANGQLVPDIIRLNVENVELSGTCLGLESIDRYRLLCLASPPANKMFPRRTGLCYVLDPEWIVKAELQLAADQLLFIPASGQSLTVDLDIE